MSNINNGRDRATIRLRWIARIWGTVIIAIALLVLIGNVWSWVTMGEADPYAVEDYPLIENVPPLFALLSAVGLAVAWLREGIGGTITLVFSLATLPILLIHWPIAQDFPRYLVAPYGVWMVIIVPGMLVAVEKTGDCSRRMTGFVV